MADEEKDSSAEKKKAPEASAPVAKPKSDMMMYIIVGVGALVVTVSVMFALLSGEQPSTAAADGESSAEEHAVAEEETEEELDTPDIFSELDDLSFLADTEFAELENPTESAEGHKNSRKSTKKNSKSKKHKAGSSSKTGANDASSMTADDSLSALSWIEVEKRKIATRNKALDEKARRLEALERTVNQKLTKVDQVEAARLTGLAKLYNGMKADQVARMMIKLDDKMIVAILPRMKSAQASKILGLLPASRGARISQEMVTLSSK